MLKEQIKKKFKKKYRFQDLGTDNLKKSVNYPDYAHKLCRKVSNNSKNMGILVCGSGMGMSMAANKHKGIRAAICWNNKIAELATTHNRANVLCIPARFISKEEQRNIFDSFINAEFQGGRHTRRVDKIDC
mgnify:CR=1 FL=1